MEEQIKVLKQIINSMTADEILSYGEVSSFFLEEFNNEIITILEEIPSLYNYLEGKPFHTFINMTHFREEFTEKLGMYIDDNSGLEYISCSGPFGLNSNFILNFINDKGNEVSFSFFPTDYKHGRIGVFTEPLNPPRYKEGTIGALNQGNLKSIELPIYLTIDELIEKYVK